MRRILLAILVAGWSTVLAGTPSARAPDPAVRRAVSAIKPGMDVKEVEAVLKPVLVASAYEFAGGTGRHCRWYHLKGDREVVIEFGGLDKLNRVEAVGALSPRSKWRGLFWDPARQDAEQARDIARKHLNRELARGAVLTKKYKTNPAGRRVSALRVPMTLTLKSGDRAAFTASASGRYVTHKLVVLDLLAGDRWVSQVVVDMDGKEVVPRSWTPTAKDIARARKIADPTVKDFLGRTEAERKKVTVKAWGDYDYGPLRRLVVLSYERPDRTNGLGIEGTFRVVDIESGKLDE